MDIPMERNLRLLQPTWTRALPSRGSGAAGPFWWGVLAIFLQFLITVNLLHAAGINVPLKVHPGTVIVLLCAIYLLLRGEVPLYRRFRTAPGLMLYLFGIPLLGIYSIMWNGYSGSAVYIESFWSAGLLAIALEPGTAKQKRLLAKILITLCVVNSLVGIYESLTHTNWFPLAFDEDIADLTEELSRFNVDFRANAFYSHPLGASVVTTMAIFLLYRMQIRFVFAAPIFIILFVGLFAFGGRAALGVTVVVSALAALYLLLLGIIRRHLELDFVLAILAAVAIIPLLVAFIVTQTTIAERIIDNLYYDDSAAVRSIQWEVLGHLTLRNWLFGISLTDLENLKYQIGLSTKGTDIENFWLLVFLSLGGIGFVVFLGLFGGFLCYLCRRTRNIFGWLLMLSALVIDSTSNSLGVKSNDLFIETGFLISMVGYEGFVATRYTRWFNRVRVITQAHQGIGGVPLSHARHRLKLHPNAAEKWKDH
jgi:hypothetical protein